MGKANANRAICNYCHKVFVKENEDQKNCSYLCDRYSKSNKRKPIKRCSVCLKLDSLTKGLCTTCYKHKEKDSCYVKKGEKVNKIEKANQNWINRQPLTEEFIKKRTKNFRKANNALIYKRAFDEKGWVHYCKGRKWDRI